MSDRNPNKPGTLEYAVRHAMTILGADTVSKIIGCSADLLYKATSANPTRELPDLTWSQVSELVRRLKGKRKRRPHHAEPDGQEHFSAALRAIGRRRRVHSVDPHHCMTRATSDVGKFAKILCSCRDKNSPGGAKITKDELSALGQAGTRAMRSISGVMDICAYYADETDNEPLEVDCEP